MFSPVSENGLKVHQRITTQNGPFPLSLLATEKIWSPRICGRLKNPRFWSCLKCSFHCPTQYLLRMGKGGDGGKWTCGVEHLGNLTTLEKSYDCVVYSFGVNSDSSFEADILKTTKCEVFAYDPTVSKIGAPILTTNPRAHFAKLGIGANITETMRNLKAFMEINGGHQWIDVLKMDVESSEFEVLDDIFKTFPELPFGQLLIEFHNFKKDSATGLRIMELIRKLEEHGLKMFYNEINSYNPYTSCEFSFINVNAIGLFISSTELNLFD